MHHRAIEFATREEALQRSEQEATARGCRGVTKYWWTLHEQNGNFYLLVGDGKVEERTVNIQINETPTEREI